MLSVNVVNIHIQIILFNFYLNINERLVLESKVSMFTGLMEIALLNGHVRGM